MRTMLGGGVAGGSPSCGVLIVSPPPDLADCGRSDLGEKSRSVLDQLDGGTWAALHGQLDLGAQILAWMLEQDLRLVVVAHPEDLRRMALAHRVALAQILIDDYSHGALPDVADVAGRSGGRKDVRRRRRVLDPMSRGKVSEGMRMPPSGVSTMGESRRRRSTGASRPSASATPTRMSVLA